jgi:hypothetical protein
LLAQLETSDGNFGSSVIRATRHVPHSTITLTAAAIEFFWKSIFEECYLPAAGEQ